MAIPYVDAGSFRLAPTGLDLNTLIPVGSEQDQAAELTNVLLRASRWVDIITEQKWGLAASLNQDPPRRVRADPTGSITYAPLTFPIVSVVAGQWWYQYPGTVPTKTAINTSMVTVLDRTIMLSDTWSYSSSRAWGSPPLFVQLQYENGYAHTTLATTASAGATSVTLTSAIGVSGLQAGLTAASSTPYLSILDGNQREDIVVQSVSGNTLTLETGLQFSHSAGVIVTGIPMDIQESTIELATFLVKTRDAGGIVMDERGFGQNESARGIAEGMGLDVTFKRLHHFKRVGGA